MATTINEIKTFKHRKGQGQRAKGKICNKCGTSHPPRECPVWGKKCHKCGNKNHFSTPGTENPIAHPEDIRAEVSHIIPGLEASW